MKKRGNWGRAVLLMLTVGLFLGLTGWWLAAPDLFQRRIGGSWTLAMATGLAAWLWLLVALVLVPRSSLAETERRDG